MENFNLSSFKTYKSVIEDIKEYSQEAVLNFLQIGRLFKRVKEEKLYEIEDYSSVYEFALNKFGYRETSVKNFIAVFENMLIVKIWIMIILILKKNIKIILLHHSLNYYLFQRKKSEKNTLLK